MKQILVLEDNQEINAFISKTLKDEGYHVFSSYDAFHAEKTFREEKIDLIVSDLMLPIKSGEAFIKEIRKQSNVHIIIISAKAELDDKLEGLKSGADDYLVKPFSKDELILKIRNYFQKLRKNEEEISLNKGEIVFSLHNNVLVINNDHIDLTSVEFQLLKMLFMHVNQIVSRAQILDHLYDYSIEVYDRVVDTHIKNIRQKIRPFYEKELIKTVYGLGYTLVGELDE